MAENLITARTPEDAVGISTAGESIFLAGGTEIMRLNSYVDADSYVSVRRVPEMRGVSADADTVTVGASCTFQELIDSEAVPEYLKDALRFMASRTRRNMATIGGNIAICRDDSFLIPTLMAASASLELMESETVKSSVPVEKYVFNRDMYNGQLITQIKLPRNVSVKSCRSANTAQSHARMTASLGLCDGIYRGFAAIKNYGIIKADSIVSLLNSRRPVSEDEIVETAKNDTSIDLKDDQLYGGAAYRNYLIGISFALMYGELNGKGENAL